MELTTAEFAGDAGLKLVADVGGDPSAPAVIFTHGGGQTRHAWHKATQDFAAQGYRVVSLDARGHGDSAWAPDGDYSLSAVVADLRAVLSQLPGRPALVGASMGGLTSLVAIGESPTPIASHLVLVDVVPRVERGGVKKIRAFMSANPQGFATIDEAADAVAAYNPHRPRPRDVSGLMRNLRLRADGRLHWHWDPRFLTPREKFDPMLLEQRLRDAATRVQVPTLLVRGAHSDIVSETGVAELRSLIPHAEIVDIAGAGHMVAGDRNDVFSHAAAEFLRRHSLDRNAPSSNANLSPRSGDL